MTDSLEIDEKIEKSQQRNQSYKKNQMLIIELKNTIEIQITNIKNIDKNINTYDLSNKYRNIDKIQKYRKYR